MDATAQDTLVKAYRAELLKATRAADPTAARTTAISDLLQKLYLGNADKNLSLAEAMLKEMFLTDFPAGMSALLGTYYSNDVVKGFISRLPPDLQDGVRAYCRWTSTNYDAEHSNPPSSIPYPATLPPPGYGWGKMPAPGTYTASAASAPARAFTADDLAHRQYGYYQRFHDNTSRIVIVRSHPEQSCFTYQSGTQWAYFKVLTPAQLWEGDQVWWHDTLQVVSVHGSDTSGIYFGAEKHALRDLPATLLTVREYRLSPDYHDVRCTRCDGRGWYDDPRNKDRGVSYGRGSVQSVSTDRHPDGTATVTTRYNTYVTGSTLLPNITCSSCNGRGYVHQRDYVVEYRP